MKAGQVWVVEYRQSKRAKIWHYHDTFETKKEAKAFAKDWWGPKGHDCPYRVRRYVPA